MQIFSTDLKRMMRDCILAVMWPKKDIITFFIECHCPKSLVSSFPDTYKRHEIITEVFSRLTDRADCGTLQFNTMLESLASWSHFDDFWFNKEKKLDLGEAKRKIAALKSAKEKNVDKVKETTKKIYEQRKERQDKASSVMELKNDFLSISQGNATSQNRGYAFEKFLLKLARSFDLKVTEPFRVTGTQIDGTLKYDGENYTIEAKWHSKELSDEPLMAFAHKQEMNMHGRGVFVSIGGYTAGALSMLERASVKNTILVDGQDIILVLDELISFTAMLDAKIHAAQTQGRFYINPITLKSKI